MAISINPVLPVLSAQEAGGIAPELVLQPGSVVNAQVLKVLSADLVRIAIASLSIDVATEIPLQQGQNLQLAVSQTKDGIRLAMVGQGGAAADAVTLSPDALADVPANHPAIVSPKNVLTPLERVAVSAAAQAAVTEQDSLAPLFANLGAAVSASNLPPKLQAAIAQVLAQQTSLDQNLDGGDIKTAFQKSGIFLEASLAAGTVPPSGVPDLKAALIVLRQTLQSALGFNSTVATPAAPAGAQQAAAPQAAASLVPSLPANVDVQEILLPQARLPAAENLAAAGQAARSPLAAALNAGPSAGATLNLLQEALQKLGNPARAAATSNVRGADVTFHTNTPPPPVRGALPAAQPIASPTIAPHAPLEATAHHLLDDTDAAIARQTLLQVASLPDRIDTSAPKADMNVPRWNFEIPFATPQGTAMAQFEISRDGGEQEVEAARRVWRARFSLDVEPAGPVHALISLTGEKTSVRIWAERPATAEQLRAGASDLSQALSRAELQPGDIVIRDGAPPQPARAARAGHFLDRAL
ncbi:flagellar hook-length control protein FliK [Bradyrhizobium sp. 190]|uniref:flagellar hook-length control protein FliK n=1 Tax=Bradyrhizobium sp. 190 TaxID=2782658 RepID=UPI001FFC238A|nr:flagellar hook-length control protein FliK [Bradyrhizobium sp. 190]MCK1512580.1 flagellar hook-length control protein FliK [Bradyrhizobium sp. 190]